MKKVMDYLTGFHNIPMLADASKPMGVRTVNADYLDIPRKEDYVNEIAVQRKSLEGVLDSTDIIRDTFKK